MFILLKTKNNKKIISRLLFSPKKNTVHLHITLFLRGFFAQQQQQQQKKKRKKKKKKKRKRETRNVDVSSAIQTLPKFHILFFSFLSSAVPFSKFLSVSTLLASAATFFSFLFWVPWTMAMPLSSLWLEARSTYLCSFFNSDWKLTTETWWQAQALWNMLWLLLWCSNGKVVCLDPFANSKYFQFYVGICV